MKKAEVNSGKRAGVPTELADRLRHWSARTESCARPPQPEEELVVGRVNRLPATIEWLTDNGSCYTAKETRRFAREINLKPRTTPIESPQSNGMAEAFVRTMKRDYVRVAEKPNARAVINQLHSWSHHYNTLQPHRALGYLAPREYITRSTSEELSGN